MYSIALATSLPRESLARCSRKRDGSRVFPLILGGRHLVLDLAGRAND
jgi:hypothetical protein